MTSEGYVKKLDWQSAIAAAKQELEAAKNKDAVAYLSRSIARCFAPDKDMKYKDAIEDLSNAIYLKRDIDKAYYYRAYAFFLDQNYEKAIKDCLKTNIPCKHELLGKIYLAMNNHENAVKSFSNAMKCYLNSENQIIPSGLMDSYREACRKMNSQG